MPWEIDRERPPPGIERLELSQRSAPQPTIERQPVEENERRTVIRSAEVVGGEASVGSRGKLDGVLHLYSLGYRDNIYYHRVP